MRLGGRRVYRNTPASDLKPRLPSGRGFSFGCHLLAKIVRSAYGREHSYFGVVLAEPNADLAPAPRLGLFIALQVAIMNEFLEGL
jgi:hypothetical protein